MNRDEAIQHYRKMNDWLQSLSSVGSNCWLEPMQEGKWSMAEVIAHLLYWDRYVREQRIPFFLEGAKLPPAPEVESFNAEAARYARSGVGQLELLHEIVGERQAMLQLIASLTDEQWTRPFQVGQREYTLKTYLSGFAQHDNHHQEQINDYLANV